MTECHVDDGLKKQSGGALNDDGLSFLPTFRHQYSTFEQKKKYLVFPPKMQAIV